MINFSLYAKPASKEAHSTIYLRINKNSEKVRISTRVVIPDRHWNQASQMVVNGGDFDLAFYREKLSKIVSRVEEIVRTANLEDWEITRVLEVVQSSLNVKSTVKMARGVLSLYEEWATLGTATKTTPRRQDKQRFTVFKEFVKGNDLPFEKVDYSFYTDFLLYLRHTKKYTENTVGTHISSLKAVMSEGLKRNYHKALDFQNFQRPQEEIVNVNLTEKEIGQMLKLKLNGVAEKVRDMFVFGCYVAQRHSDYSKATDMDVKGDFIEVVQKKTRRRIKIPLHPIAKVILEKYNGRFPTIDLAIFNTTIKEVAHFAKINEKIFTQVTKAGKLQQKYVEKWQLITSHTARKSGVTNALRAGVPIEDCMYLAGIKSP
ncbi:MAG: site-specific integrase, partial [Bacteroidales bacterium]|nr:site-specific integrase [Bacteroidales bacterium]